MHRKRATIVLLAALLVPLSPAYANNDAGAMFGLMFRMMLTMMNIMSGAMLGNNNWGNNNWLNNYSNGFGGLNSFNLGMRALPMMTSFGSPWNSFGGTPWNSMGWSPWSSFGGMPWGAAGSPWSSYGGMPWGAAGSPWTQGWNNPWSGGWGNPWSSGWGATPTGAGYPGYAPGGAYPGRGYGYPINYGTGRPGYGGGASLLDGRWYGNNGEILEISGNRFQLQAGATGLQGVVRINDNILSLYSPETNTETQYTFVRNQTGLLLQDANGNVLQFTQNPAEGGVRIF